MIACCALQEAKLVGYAKKLGEVGAAQLFVDAHASELRDDIEPFIF